MDTIKNLPWGLIAKWVGVLIGLFFIAGWYRSRAAASAAQAGADGGGDTGGAGGVFSPMFMSAGGMPTAAGTPAAIMPLGGEAWTQPVPTSGVSDEVTIAQMQRDIAMAQLAAQQSIADRGFDSLFPTSGSLGATAGIPGYSTGGRSVVTWDQTLDPNKAIYGVEQYPTTKAPKVAQSEAISYAKAALKKGDSGLYSIYNQAQGRGYTDNDVAQIINQARGGTGSGASTASEVRAWIQKQGLKPLS